MLNCTGFSLSKMLSVSRMPTYNEVAKFYFFIKYELKPDKTSKEPTVYEISEGMLQKFVKSGKKHCFLLSL